MLGKMQTQYSHPFAEGEQKNVILHGSRGKG